MSEEALNSATVRLDRAIARIERAVSQRETAGSGMAASYALLEDRHDALRTRVQETIEKLDVLIGRESKR